MDPRLKGVDYDSDDLITIHRQILMEKEIMRDVFAEFYDLCIALDKKFFSSATEKRVEIGAGVSFFKDRHPYIISSDIKHAPHLDMVVDAQQMEFPKNSVRAFYGINCFHHFPDPQLFFNELSRTLTPGGGCVLIDPYHGWVASRFYKKLFDTESFDKDQKEWTNKGAGVMVGANQALSYIVFCRDVGKFHHMFPELTVIYQHPLDNYIRYLLSGGLNFRALVPAFLSPVIRIIEILISPLNRFFALHQVIVIRKKK
jgi:SAM-dependent methyltransferase